MNLFEINSEINQIINDPEIVAFLEESGGLFPEGFEKKLEALDIARESKIVNIAKQILNLSAQSKAVAEQKEKFAKWETTLENEKRFWKDWLKSGMTDGEKIKTSEVSISWTHRDAVEITDPVILPAEYYKAPPPPEPSKTMIGDTLKAGGEVPGAKLVRNAFIVIK